MLRGFNAPIKSGEPIPGDTSLFRRIETRWQAERRTKSLMENRKFHAENFNTNEEKKKKRREKFTISNR